MKRFVAALAWKRSVDEKIPLSTNKIVADNGAITKSSPSEPATEKIGKDKMADGKVTASDAPFSDLEEPMSLLRRSALVLSFNIIALYFVAFAFIIPCNMLDCETEQKWTVDLNNISISTNLEVTGLPNFECLIFGYLNESEEGSRGGGVTALSSSMGTVMWEGHLNFIPLNCRCNVVDVNGDRVKDCLIFGESNLLALNVSNGHVFWAQEFATISPLYAVVNSCEDLVSEWIVLVESNRSMTEEVNSQDSRISMVILDSKNGTVVDSIPLPCDSFPKQLVTWKSVGNNTHLAFQCPYNDTAEVQLISEEEICKDLFKSATKNVGFYRLFSFLSSTAVDDVLLLPVSHVGLMVGWSTMVAMATDSQNRPRLLWQTTSGSIRSLLSGHFTTKNSTQIAVALQDGFSVVVKLVDVSAGKELKSIELDGGELISVSHVYRTGNGNDSLIIVKEEAISSAPNGNGSDIIDFTTENASAARTPYVSSGVRSYMLLTFGEENNLTEILKENKRTEVAVNSANCTMIFLATCLSNRTTRISSRDMDLNSECSCR